MYLPTHVYLRRLAYTVRISIYIHCTRGVVFRVQTRRSAAQPLAVKVTRPPFYCISAVNLLDSYINACVAIASSYSTCMYIHDDFISSYNIFVNSRSWSYLQRLTICYIIHIHFALYKISPFINYVLAEGLPHCRPSAILLQHILFMNEPS